MTFLYQGKVDAQSSQFKPWGDRVLVHVPDEAKMVGSIIIPATAMGRFDVHVTEVVAVGPECKHVKPGDRVMHVKVVGVSHRFQSDGKDFRILHEHEILGVVEGEAAA